MSNGWGYRICSEMDKTDKGICITYRRLAGKTPLHIEKKTTWADFNYKLFEEHTHVGQQPIGVISFKDSK